MNKLNVVIVGGWAQGAATYLALARAFEVDAASDAQEAQAAVTITILPLESDVPTLHEKLSTLAAEFKRTGMPVLWVGCSLGGLYLLQWLNIRASTLTNHGVEDGLAVSEYLVLFGTNPQFCERPSESWPGLPIATLDTMIDELAKDHSRTIRAFNVLQCSQLRGVRRKAALNVLMRSPSRASCQVMKDGLEILRASDHRAVLAGCSIPVLVLIGGLDPLTGTNVAKALVNLLAATRNSESSVRLVKLIEDAGHYPDESDSAAIVAHCRSFLRQNYKDGRGDR